MDNTEVISNLYGMASSFKEEEKRMERMEKLREYCIDRAIEILKANPKPWICSTQDVVKTAKELEKYITK